MDMEREIYPKSNCLALTVRKEHRLVCINREKQLEFLGKLYYMLYS